MRKKKPRQKKKVEKKLIILAILTGLPQRDVALLWCAPGVAKGKEVNLC